MNDTEARGSIMHLHALYPKAAEHWSVVRQQAFRDQIAPLPITVEQFRAAANAVAMANKPSWCPPESAILTKLRGLAESVNTTRRVEATRSVARQIDPNDRTFDELTREYIANPELQDNLEPAGLRMLSSLMGRREASVASLSVVRGVKR